VSNSIRNKEYRKSNERFSILIVVETINTKGVMKRKNEGKMKDIVSETTLAQGKLMALNQSNNG